MRKRKEIWWQKIHNLTSDLNDFDDNLNWIFSSVLLVIISSQSFLYFCKKKWTKNFHLPYVHSYLKISCNHRTPISDFIFNRIINLTSFYRTTALTLTLSTQQFSLTAVHGIFELFFSFFYMKGCFDTVCCFCKVSSLSVLHCTSSLTDLK